MRNIIAVLLFEASVAAVSTTAFADPLPRSGSFAVDSGWKATGETVQVAEGRVFGWGAFHGVTFNAQPNGPLHTGTAICSYTLDLTQGAGPSQGSCAWTDAQGDRIFSTYTGALKADGMFNGLNRLVGGTGKFSGVSGQASFDCRALSDKGHFACTQRFEYRLP